MSIDDKITVIVSVLSRHQEYEFGNVIGMYATPEIAQKAALAYVVPGTELKWVPCAVLAEENPSLLKAEDGSQWFEIWTTEVRTEP